ncbi:hypothetical protein LZK98_11480 [Sphingomonas cannabina]|uniref:hypothetical protein n=1 Tax=Sphingomonas cannabina TaxID=2899123 RepID=UPI001F296052|nr:hypothetical protein [Sphingomonas cannabina]UIJ43711.1 hypothetical protein LZK98_11480 [Sphingomonas cannabina]
MADGVDLQKLVEREEVAAMPLTQIEPNGRSRRDPDKFGAMSTRLGDELALLATKIAPTMSEGQADAWVKVMVAALSDLPGRVAIEAARQALHRPMEFISQVEGVVREQAVLVAARHHTALSRLRSLQAAIANPPIALPDPSQVPERRYSPAAIRRLSKEFRAIGVRVGAFTQDEVDRAMAEQFEDEGCAAA